METVLTLDDDLLNQARAVASEKHTTLDVIVAEALRKHLSAGSVDSERFPVFRGGTGLATDLCSPSTKSLMEAADEADYARGHLR